MADCSLAWLPLRECSVWGGKDYCSAFEHSSALLRLYEPEIFKGAVVMTPVKQYRHESPLYTHTVVAVVYVPEKNRYEGAAARPPSLV